MSKRAHHIRKAESLLAGADDGIQKLSVLFGDIPNKESVAISTWLNALTNAAQAHTALAEHYALWENDDA